MKLQAAYKMNLSFLINHGKIQYQSTKVGEKAFDSYEILTAVDLITLTAKAKILKMYNVAIGNFLTNMFHICLLSNPFIFPQISQRQLWN